MTKYTLGRVKGDQGDAGTWTSVTFTNGILYYNSTLRLVQVFYDDSSFAHIDDRWGSVGVTVPSPYRPKRDIYCSCSNFNTLGLIKTSGAIEGVHRSSTNQTGLSFSVMYHY